MHSNMTVATTAGIGSVLLVGLMAASVGMASNPGPDPVPVAAFQEIPLSWSLIVGPDECANCHIPEFNAWEQTHHKKTYKASRARRKRIKEILGNLGRSTSGIKDASAGYENACLKCHYTVAIINDEPTAKWGVTCESCHGPARDWLDIHQRVGGTPDGDPLDWGTGKNQDQASRDARLAAAAKAGMLHPERIYDIAVNCYGCHTVPDETLVNTGNHKAGSDFDLLAWSQGEVRHSFCSSPGAPDSATNEAASPERQRQLYVVGAIVDLEFSLRNLTGVKEPGGAYQSAMIARVNTARSKVEAIASAANLPALETIIARIPSPVDADSAIPPDVADQLGAFAKGLDAGALDAVSVDPSNLQGEVFTP